MRQFCRIALHIIKANDGRGGIDMRTIEDAIKNYNHICWYPSAGEDFKPLLFISNWYYKKNSVPMDEGQVLRNCLIFLHS